MAPLAKGYLLDTKPVSVNDKTVRIGFDPEFSDGQDKINIPRNIKTIQKVLTETLKRPIHVEFAVLENQDTLPGDIKVAPADLEKDKAEDTKDVDQEIPSIKNAAKTKQEWLKDPAVRKTLEMFNGDIVDIRA